MRCRVSPVDGRLGGATGRGEVRSSGIDLLCREAHPMRCEVEPARCDLEHRGRAGRTIGTSPCTYYSPPNANYTHLFVELGRAGRAKARGAADWRAGGFFLAPPTKVFLRLMPVQPLPQLSGQAPLSPIKGDRTRSARRMS